MNIVSDLQAKPKYRVHSTSEIPKTVFQREYCIIDDTTPFLVIGTMGLGPCIALVVHNSETSTAAVAHFDAMTIVQSATGMLKKVIGSSTNDKITVYLVGGECIDLMIVEIYQLLQSFDLVDRIVAASIFNRRYDDGNIAINRLTGQICNLVPTSIDPPMISLWDKVPLQFSPAIIRPAL